VSLLEKYDLTLTARVLGASTGQAGKANVAPIVKVNPKLELDKFAEW
jgi:hypothetical protein